MWAKMRRRWAMGVFSKWILLEWNIPWGLKMLLCVMSCVISRKQHIDFVPTLSVIFITKLQVDITVFRFWRLENISVRILEVYIVDSSLDRKRTSLNWFRSTLINVIDAPLFIYLQISIVSTRLDAYVTRTIVVPEGNLRQDGLHVSVV